MPWQLIAKLTIKASQSEASFSFASIVFRDFAVTVEYRKFTVSVDGIILYLNKYIDTMSM